VSLTYNEIFPIWNPGKCTSVPVGGGHGGCKDGGCCSTTLWVWTTCTEDRATACLKARTNIRNPFGIHQFWTCEQCIELFPPTTAPITVRGIVNCLTYPSPCDPNACCHNHPEYGAPPRDSDNQYECDCDHGWRGDGESISECWRGTCTGCTDVNECAEHTHNCDVNAICINNQGSYDCVCKAGYEGDGFTCVLSTPYCYERYINYAGNDIAQRNGITSPEECREICQGMNNCNLWSLNTNNNNCCLKDIIGTVTTAGQHRISGTKYCPETCYAYDVDYNGNEIADLTGIQSEERCQLQCQQNPHCVAWVYGFPSNRCWLLNTVTRGVAHVGRISGPENCLGDVTCAPYGRCFGVTQYCCPQVGCKNKKIDGTVCTDNVECLSGNCAAWYNNWGIWRGKKCT